MTYPIHQFFPVMFHYVVSLNFLRHILCICPQLFVQLWEQTPRFYSPQLSSQDFWWR